MCRHLTVHTKCPTRPNHCIDLSKAWCTTAEKKCPCLRVRSIHLGNTYCSNGRRCSGGFDWVNRTELAMQECYTDEDNERWEQEGDDFQKTNVRPCTWRGLHEVLLVEQQKEKEDEEEKKVSSSQASHASLSTENDGEIEDKQEQLTSFELSPSASTTADTEEEQETYRENAQVHNHTIFSSDGSGSDHSHDHSANLCEDNENHAADHHQDNSMSDTANLSSITLFNSSTPSESDSEIPSNESINNIFENFSDTNEGIDWPTLTQIRPAWLALRNPNALFEIELQDEHGWRSARDGDWDMVEEEHEEDEPDEGGEAVWEVIEEEAEEDWDTVEDDAGRELGLIDPDLLRYLRNWMRERQPW